jgi:hypothetical protein
MPSGRVVLLTVRPTARIVPRRDRPHHIYHASRKAEQQKHDQPPRRDSQQAIKPPADASTDQDPAYEFAGEPKPARVSRRIGGRLAAARFRRLAWPVLAKPIAETPEPRGKSSLVGSAPLRIVAVTRVTRHFDATCAPLTNRFPAPLKAARTILAGDELVKNRNLLNLLKACAFMSNGLHQRRIITVAWASQC